MIGWLISSLLEVRVSLSLQFMIVSDEGSVQKTASKLPQPFLQFQDILLY